MVSLIQEEDFEGASSDWRHASLVLDGRPDDIDAALVARVGLREVAPPIVREHLPGQGDSAGGLPRTGGAREEEVGQVSRLHVGLETSHHLVLIDNLPQVLGPVFLHPDLFHLYSASDG